MGLLSVLICYVGALYFLVPTFNPDIIKPGFANLATYASITYGLGTFSAYFSRMFYVFDVSFKFELIAGIGVVMAYFVLVGPPVSPAAI